MPSIVHHCQKSVIEKLGTIWLCYGLGKSEMNVWCLCRWQQEYATGRVEDQGLLMGLQIADEILLVTQCGAIGSLAAS